MKKRPVKLVVVGSLALDSLKLLLKKEKISLADR